MLRDHQTSRTSGAPHQPTPPAGTELLNTVDEDSVGAVDAGRKLAQQVAPGLRTVARYSGHEGGFTDPSSHRLEDRCLARALAADDRGPSAQGIESSYEGRRIETLSAGRQRLDTMAGEGIVGGARRFSRWSIHRRSTSTG
jgi:hypothetical protein